jgi:hypothetical protein
MDLTQLLQLQEKLMRESDLASIWLFYMDNFMDCPELDDASYPKSNPLIEALIPKICKQLLDLKKKTTIEYLLLTVSEYYFYHAPLMINGAVGGLIYFEDINMGLIAIADNSPGSKTTKFSRFSVSSPKPFKGFGKR